MKLSLILIISIFIVILSLNVFAEECKVDLEKYTSMAKEYINSNPEDKNIQYATRLIGKNSKVEVLIDSDIWHAELQNGKVKAIAKGKLEKKDFSVSTTMCTLQDLESGKLDIKSAIKNKKITYKGYGFINNLKLRIAKLFLK